MSMKELYEKYENYIVVAVATVLFGGILFGTGTIFSGWHLVERWLLRNCIVLFCKIQRKTAGISTTLMTDIMSI